MKLCIPVCQPDGLESMIHPHLPDAEHLLFFDVATRQYEHLALRDPDSGAGRTLTMDAVLCGSINRMVLRQLIEQGIKVYGVEPQTVAQAIARFENGELEAVVAGSGGCGGHGHAHAGGGCGGDGHARQGAGCGGHGHAREGGGCGGHGHAGGGCGGHGDAHEGGGCGGHAHAHGADGGACCGGHAPAATVRRRSPGDPLRVAICSQNRKTVTEHAGKCRKFWIYEVSEGQVTGRTLLELPLDQSLHASPAGAPHPLDGIDVLIAAGAGGGLTQRLAQQGIECVVTGETDLDLALAGYLAGADAGKVTSN